MNFEESLKQLEGLVGQMESGKQNLDEMIKSFERGRKLVAECQQELKAVQLKIEKVAAGGAVEDLKLETPS